MFWQEAILVPWKSLPKRMSKLYFAMRGTTDPTVNPSSSIFGIREGA